MGNLNPEIRDYLQREGVSRENRREWHPKLQMGLTSAAPDTGFHMALPHTVPSLSPLDLEAGESDPCFTSKEAETLADKWFTQGCT